MDIKRDKYLNDLINRMHNGMIKVVTGIRRCGKSYLLFNIFKNYLLEHGVTASHIITIELDQRKNKKYRDPDTILDYIESLIEDDEQYYIMLDEVQMLQEFEEVLNSLLHIRNADIYVTGSNSKFLSKDVITEFRGRGDEIHIYPLTFKEFMEAYDGDMYRGWAEYVVYGGLPLTVTMKTEEQKTGNGYPEHPELKRYLQRRGAESVPSTETSAYHGKSGRSIRLQPGIQRQPSGTGRSLHF